MESSKSSRFGDLKKYIFRSPSNSITVFQSTEILCLQVHSHVTQTLSETSSLAKTTRQKCQLDITRKTNFFQLNNSTNAHLKKDVAVQ